MAFVVFVLLLATIWRSRARGSSILFAIVLSAWWAAGITLHAEGRDEVTLTGYLLELVFDFGWITFVALQLDRGISTSSVRLLRLGGPGLAVAAILAGVLAAAITETLPGREPLATMLYAASIATSLAGFIMLEQLVRNARPRQREAIKYLVVGIGGIFTYDLVLYTEALLAQPDASSLWAMRGYVVVLCTILIGLSLHNNSSWGAGILLSRRVYYFSGALLGSAIYVGIVLIAVIYARQFGGEVGELLPIFIVFLATLGLVLATMSEKFRARIRVELAKNFFERKFDYRREWLRLIDTLTASDDPLPPRKRAIKSLAQVVGAGTGSLWMKTGRSASFEVVSSWNEPMPDLSIPPDDPMLVFLRESGWVIDFQDVGDSPEVAAVLASSTAALSLPPSGILVPLQHEDSLVGFVRLDAVSVPKALNFEDFDLLKTAGTQVASFLMQLESSERLAEGRQFEAYNRFTAYVMHDLKNAIAQQSLVVDNAARHKRNPEFVDDAIETIKGSVVRMKRVLQNLQQRSIDEPLQRVNLTKLVLHAKSQCADRDPVPELSIPGYPVVVMANQERLLTAVCNAVRNAQDATPADGEVGIELTATGDSAVVSIRDSGVGMDEEFVRQRLFRPFDSTKGAEGMGIGAYQLRETVISIGGEVSVTSASQEGTCVKLTIPLAPQQTAG